jgi:PPK2 family polyphosphate:nucleotide phosphotransferase
MGYALPVEPGSKVKLKKIDPGDTGDLSKEDGLSKVDTLAPAISDLQELLYAAADHSLLIILQGMDTSGKDGTIRKVMRNVSPLGCRVWPFKVPTPLELSHDFLWRVHAKVPELGMMTIFNRSHYEDVLVPRVHDLVSEETWHRRYDQINDFERLLAESGTIILKFFLHISEDEQENRLRAREANREKAWKLSTGDWVERQHWDAYMEAYEELLSRCSTSYAPWYIIPANKKWFRDVAIAETIVETLQGYKSEWLRALTKRGQAELKELESVRPADPS